MAQLTKRLVVNCMRNTKLEYFYAGRSPVSHADDYGDVQVVDVNGDTISWTEVSHISDAEMKALMQRVVNRVYTFLKHMDDPQFVAMVAR